jgi:hypothetical protein
MTHYIVTLDGTVRSYKTASAARDMGLQLNTASSPKQTAFVATDDDLSQLPSALLVTLHNLIRPEKPIKKFADRETADKRMKGVLEVLAKPGEVATAPAGEVEVTEEKEQGEEAATEGNTESTEGTTNNTEDSDMAAKKGRKSAKKATAKKSATEGEGAGRPSAFAGKVIRKVATSNPRREGTHGYNSWEALKSGMTYEKYIAAGGRRQDLAWDLAKGYIKLEKA